VQVLFGDGAEEVHPPLVDAQDELGGQQADGVLNLAHREEDGVACRERIDGRLVESYALRGGGVLRRTRSIGDLTHRGCLVCKVKRKDDTSDYYQTCKKLFPSAGKFLTLAEQVHAQRVIKETVGVVQQVPIM